MLSYTQPTLFDGDGLCQRWTERRGSWQQDTGERFTGRGYTVEDSEWGETA